MARCTVIPKITLYNYTTRKWHTCLFRLSTFTLCHSAEPDLLMLHLGSLCFSFSDVRECFTACVSFFLAWQTVL
jgi:hypothetical protein